MAPPRTRLGPEVRREEPPAFETGSWGAGGNRPRPFPLPWSSHSASSLSPDPLGLLKCGGGGGDRRGKMEAELPLSVAGPKEPFPPRSGPSRPLPWSQQKSGPVPNVFAPSSLFSLELLILLPAKLRPPKVFFKNINEITSLPCLVPSSVLLLPKKETHTVWFLLTYPTPSLPPSLPLALFPFLRSSAS